MAKFELSAISSSARAIANTIREQRSKPGDDAVGDAAKPDPE